MQGLRKGGTLGYSQGPSLAYWFASSFSVASHFYQQSPNFLATQITFAPAATLASMLRQSSELPEPNPV